jgi:low temperature requirement protein LtrA
VNTTLRPRGDGPQQPTTTIELFFDLVYVFAITQLSHLILGDLSVAGVARAAFLLLIVCEGFIVIALGESIVVTGATAADVGLTATVVLCLGVAFLQTAALWWLYFGAVAEHTRLVMRTCEDPGRLARDAYTYLHVPIVASIIAVAVGDDLLIAEPWQAAHGVGLAVVLGGPVLFLVGERLYSMRVTGAANAKRFAVAGLLVLLAPVGAHISALALSAIVGALLIGLALWESPPAARPARGATGVRHGRAWRAGGRPSIRQQQQEGTSS